MIKNRLLIELENIRKGVNRSVINPLLPELSIESLTPLLTMVAEARAQYVKAILDLSQTQQGHAPSMAQIEHLQQQRIIFEELVAGVNALEAVVQRDYMDVKPTRPHVNNPRPACS